MSTTARSSQPAPEEKPKEEEKAPVVAAAEEPATPVAPEVRPTTMAEAREKLREVLTNNPGVMPDKVVLGSDNLTLTIGDLQKLA